MSQSRQLQTNSMSESNVCDVWSSNLKSEMRNVNELVNEYNYISVDISYDGMARAVNDIHVLSYYDSIRCDVHQTNVTQIGLSLFNSFGETPQHMSRIQFNLNANPIDSQWSSSGLESILTHSSGAQLDGHSYDGIDANAFAEEMYNFGLVLVDDRSIKWISFDGGHDLAHLLKIITNNALPSTQSEFMEDIRLYFGNTFDIKYLIHSFQPNIQHFDVKRMADVMGIDRNTQSGNSFIVGTAFFKIRQYIFGNNFEEAKYNSRLFGFD